MEFYILILYNEIKLNKFGLIFNRLPSLEILERMSFIAAIIGFVFLTITIIIGIIWLPKAFPNITFAGSKTYWNICCLDSLWNWTYQ